jgi:hypothetical protein
MALFQDLLFAAGRRLLSVGFETFPLGSASQIP